MPCILWITGDFRSEEIIDKTGLQPYKIVEKDAVVATRDGERHYDHAVCGFDVSAGDFTEFKQLVEDAQQWLETHYAQLQKLESFPLQGKLDFGYYTQFADSKIVAQYDTLPHKLLKLAGDLKFDIELSQYWYAENQGAQLN